MNQLKTQLQNVASGFGRRSRQLASGVAASALLIGTHAHAALPAGVEAAVTEAQTDGVALAGLVLAVIIAIAAFKYIRRAL
ncbi:MAG: phage coat protein [Pseudomonas sp.]|nr:phage coat protein [Pseudomonas sp.]